MFQKREKKYENAFVNDYARQFREIADRDYIAARQSYRTELYTQFLWSAEQAIEKYLKCILLFNKIPVTNEKGVVRGVHDLKGLLDCFEKSKPFDLKIRPESLRLIEHLDRSAMHSRYLSAPVYVLGEHLMRLDGAIWDIRRYCKLIDYSIPMPDGTVKSFFRSELDRIEKSEKVSPQKFILDDSGFLEKVIRDKSHPARAFLIWKNNYFGGKVRRNNKIDLHSTALCPELFNEPHMVDVINKYIFIPEKTAEYLRVEAKKRDNTRSG
ncbi:MAG: HEPN domain-containing protein [Chlorobiaceae bacterium]|jgi:HEPN domain-containing protein|nr:HEPN domain-containing protein [Chlorobiaceae bacterium]